MKALALQVDLCLLSVAVIMMYFAASVEHLVVSS